MITSSLGFSESVYKTCQRQGTELKLGKMIAHSRFHRICKFENHVTRNNVIMTSLPKTMEKCGPPRNQQIIYHSKGIDESYPKNILFIEFEPLFQKLWVFMSNCIFYDGHSLNMATPRDPRSKFVKKFSFFCI